MTARVTGHETLIASQTLMEYFHDSVDGALSNQSIDAEPDTVYYLVNLLSFFSIGPITMAAIMTRPTSRLSPANPMKPRVATTGRAAGTIAARPSRADFRKIATKMRTSVNADAKLRS